MSEIFQKIKLPLILISVLVAGLILYNSFKSPKSTTLLDTKGSTAAVNAPDRDFLPLLIQIQNVNLDQKLFLDPVFRALKDWSQQIVPESIGKPNPWSSSLGASSGSNVESLGFTQTTRNATTR